MTARDRIVIVVVASLVAALGRLLVLGPRAQAQATQAVLQAQITQPSTPSADRAAGSAPTRPAGQARYRTDYATVARLGKAVPGRRRRRLARLPAPDAPRARAQDRLPLDQARGHGGRARPRRAGRHDHGRGSSASGSGRRRALAAASTPARRDAAGRASRRTLPRQAAAAAAGRDRRRRRLPDDAVHVHLRRHVLRHGALPARGRRASCGADGKRVSVRGRLLTVDGFSLGARPGGLPAASRRPSRATAYLLPADEGLTAGARPSGRDAAAPRRHRRRRRRRAVARPAAAATEVDPMNAPAQHPARPRRDALWPVAVLRSSPRSSPCPVCLGGGSATPPTPRRRSPAARRRRPRRPRRPSRSTTQAGRRRAPAASVRNPFTQPHVAQGAPHDQHGHAGARRRHAAELGRLGQHRQRRLGPTRHRLRLRRLGRHAARRRRAQADAGDRARHLPRDPALRPGGRGDADDRSATSRGSAPLPSADRPVLRLPRRAQGRARPRSSWSPPTPRPTGDGALPPERQDCQTHRGSRTATREFFDLHRRRPAVQYQLDLVHVDHDAAPARRGRRGGRRRATPRPAPTCCAAPTPTAAPPSRAPRLPLAARARRARPHAAHGTARASVDGATAAAPAVPPAPARPAGLARPQPARLAPEAIHTLRRPWRLKLDHRRRVARPRPDLHRRGPARRASSSTARRSTATWPAASSATAAAGG